MALLEESALGRRDVTTEGGSCSLWRVTDNIYVTRMRGHMTLEHARVFIEYGDMMVRRSPTGLRAFHDWLDMTGYDSRCRTEMTAWSIAHRSAYREVHLAVRSKIVAMGVQVANIALGGLIHVHRERAPVQAALLAALRDV